jgi:hypothetical protein
VPDRQGIGDAAPGKKFMKAGKFRNVPGFLHMLFRGDDTAVGTDSFLNARRPVTARTRATSGIAHSPPPRAPCCQR